MTQYDERLGQAVAPCSAEVERAQRTPAPHPSMPSSPHQEPGECICGAGFAPYCCAICWPQ
jgi:hypothetical protein